MRKLFALSLIILITVITGCANNANIDINETYWQNKPSTVVIVTTHADKLQYDDEYGSSQTIIYQMASMAFTQKLQQHLNQMSMDWYYEGLAEQFQHALAKEHIKAVIANEHPYLDPDILFNNRAKLNRVQLATEYDAEQVLVLAMPFCGASTPLQPNIFAGAPPVQGGCVLYAELSDPQHSAIYWRYTSRVRMPVVGNANQPPDYPNVTQSAVNSQKIAVEELLDSLRRGR